MRMSKAQFCTFQVEELLFGIETEKVQEVVDALDLTPVPLAPSAVRGLINLRGQIVTAIDLRTRLGLPPRDSSRKPKNIIVGNRDGVVSLLVDAIDDIVDVTPDCFEQPPATLPAVARALIKGVYKLPDRLLLVLGLDEVQRMPSSLAALPNTH
jgi:purine-binding chemotaxis protein CheW